MTDEPKQRCGTCENYSYECQCGKKGGRCHWKISIIPVAFLRGSANLRRLRCKPTTPESGADCPCWIERK